MEGAATLPEAPTAEQYAKNIGRILTTLFCAVVVTVTTLGPLFDRYLQQIGQSRGIGSSGNTLVGAVESVRGLLQLILAYPIGYVSDKISRIRLLKYNLPFWTGGVVLVATGVVTDQIVLIFCGIGMWAPASQCFNSTAQVLIGDSVPPEERPKALANLTTRRLLATSFGPLLQIILLLVLRRNEWDVKLLHSVIASGLVLWPLVICGILTLEDLPAWEKVQVPDVPEVPAASPPSVQSPEGGVESFASTGSLGSASSFSTSSGGRKKRKGTVFREEDMNRPLCCGIAVRWVIAVSLEVQSFVTALGNGMTVKFFPLFFIAEYEFTPLEICGLTMALPLFSTFTVNVCRRLSTVVGRLPACLGFHFAAVACLWVLCAVKSKWLTVPLFLLRGGLMQVRPPLMRSIIMDLVPSDRRGRWNAFQSLRIFSWSGSAALGGWIADATGGYRTAFMVTAALHTVSGLLIVPLLLIYPEETTTPTNAAVQLLDRPAGTESAVSLQPR